MPVALLTLLPISPSRANAIRFAWSGNPNTPVDHSHGSPPPPMVHWPSYNATGDANLVLDIPLATQTGLKSALCDFWDKHPLGADIVFGGKTN